MVARYAMIMPVQPVGAARPFLLRISVVKDDVPLLLSAKVLRDLGAILDMGKACYEFTKLQTTVSMVTTETGHIGFDIVGLAPDAKDLLAINWERFIHEGDEMCFAEDDRVEPPCCPQNLGSPKRDSRVVRFSPLVEYFEPSLKHLKSSSILQCLVDQHESSDARGEASGSQEEGRVCHGPSAIDYDLEGNAEFYDCGKAPSHLPECEDETSQTLACQLEEVAERKALGIVPEASDSLDGVESREGHRVLHMGAGPLDCGAGKLCSGSSSGGAQGCAEQCNFSSQVPSMCSSNGAEENTSHRRSLLAMCQLPSMSGRICRSDQWEAGSNGATFSDGSEKRGLWEWCRRLQSRFKSCGDRQHRGHEWSDHQASHSSDNSGSPRDQSGSAGDVRSRAQGEEDLRDWHANPKPESVVRDQIRKGMARRRYAKLGTCRKMLQACQVLLAASCCLAVATTSACQSALSASMFGSSRPDLLEVFGGASDVSLQFGRRGWYVLEPSDLVSFDNLGHVGVKERVLEFVQEQKPRLVVVNYPRKLWSQLTVVNYASKQRRQVLKKLKRQERPFLDLCESLFKEQLDRGDDALTESPLDSRSFNEPQMQRIMKHPDIYVGVGHGCRFNVRSSCTGLFLKRPTLWVSTSPEMCDALSLRCPNREGHWAHKHGVCLEGTDVEDAARSTQEISRAIHQGFLKTLKRKDPSRIHRLLQAVRKRLGRGEAVPYWNEEKVSKLLPSSHVMAVEQSTPADDVSMVPVENPDVATSTLTDGISFVIPKDRKLDDAMKSVLRKVHCNLGHPSMLDLKRFLRKAGAKQELVEAVGWIRCSSCASSQRPRVHRSTRIPPHDLQFNDQLMLDCFHCKDCHNDGYWFLSLLDRATMYHQLHVLKNHSQESFGVAVLEYWVRWAGRPTEISVDMERGFVGDGFVSLMGQAGISVVSIAGQAHWQHGKIERHGSIIKDMLKRMIEQTQAHGEEELIWVAQEACAAKNTLIREHGFSPAQLVFGREPRLVGELDANGEPCAYHFDAGVQGSQLARRLKFRYHARQSFIHAQSASMLNRTARNRTRPWVEPKVGDKCFFFRQVKKKGQSGLVDCWRGPALVVGVQGQSNYWVVFGGRCYLVAQEHCREAIGEEALFGRPEVQEALSLFKDASMTRNGIKYRYLTGTLPPDDAALDGPLVTNEAGDDGSDDELIPDLSNSASVQTKQIWKPGTPPEEMKCNISTPGWYVGQDGSPYLVVHNAYGLKIPLPRYEASEYPIRSTWAYLHGTWWQVEDDVHWNSLADAFEPIVGGPAQILVSLFKSKTRKDVCLDSVPECIKRRRVGVLPSETDNANQVALTVSRKAKKALDKEIPYAKIPPHQKEAFLCAEKKEWQSWCDYNAVRPLNVEESQKICVSKPERILKCRYVYRNKNAGLVDSSGNDLPLKAKARLCVQGQHCPDCASGQVKLDAPTIQHVSLLTFLHCVVSFGWCENWWSGDISSAFLQGAPSEGEPLYMYPPERGLPGISPGQILELLRPVYGRPDAPKAWYDQISGYIVNTMKFEKSILDPALFIKRNKLGEPCALLALHVDDLLVATDGSSETQEAVRLLVDRFPFGEWQKIVERPEGISYCGKEIVLEKEKGENVVVLRQRGFVDGRLETIPLSKERKTDLDAAVTSDEQTDFRSVLGALQWLATQSRPDIAFGVNQLQKRVNILTVRDLEVANQLVRIVKKNEVGIKFRNLGKDVAVVSLLIL